MKKLFLFLVVLFNPFNLFSQEIEPPDLIPSAGESLRQEYYAFDSQGNPIYRTDNVVVVYLDFTDGRDFSDGITRKQPTDTAKLSHVENFDAVGEIGLTYVPSNYPVNLGLYINPSKYVWLDRWNIFSQPMEHIEVRHIRIILRTTHYMGHKRMEALQSIGMKYQTAIIALYLL